MPMSSVAPFHAEGLEGLLHTPSAPRPAGLVLTHGAGGNCEAPVLIAAADAFCAAGLHVLRFNLPYRQRRRTGPPPRDGGAEDRQALRRAAAALRQRVSGPLYLGGHSYGGRQASMLAAEDAAIAAALLLLSYPLHPPNKPAQLRTAHFPRLDVRAVFVHGANDPFATPDELRQAVAQIPARTAIVPVAGAGHDLKRGRFDLAPIVAALTGA
jgi:uncharacterized protein